MAIKDLLKGLTSKENQLPWQVYLSRLMGRLESNKKKTIMRRNRRQPNRLDLRGELRNHRPEIAVAIDVSGSMSDGEFVNAIKEVLAIVKHYHHEILLIECDDKIRKSYKVKSEKEIQERSKEREGTLFSPVIEYLNQRKVNLLIYFTDGKGENYLKTQPKGYDILWVLSGKEEELSLKKIYGTVKKLIKKEENKEIADMHSVRSDGYSMQSQQPNF